MAKGYFVDDQSTTPLLQIVQNSGKFPTQLGGGAGTDDYIGAVRTFAFNFVPGGFQAAGQQLSVQNDTPLFLIDGTNYGGDGQTTFGLPNLPGVVAVGAGSGGVGQVTGRDVVQVDASQFPASLGGVAAPIGLGQPSLSVNYLVCTTGLFPTYASPRSSGK